MLQRPRRNRQSKAIRALVRETMLLPQHLILPLFLVDGTHKKIALESLPGQYRMSKDEMAKTIEEALNLGIRHFVLFPKIPDQLKDKTATYSYAEDNFYLHATAYLKNKFPEATFTSDVALDPYNTDGHDGIVKEGRIDNDTTLPVLARMAVAQAQAGFDIIGPSDMMDGRVLHIRSALDQAGYTDTSIMSYTAKYASAFYGPFRDALDSAPVSDPSIPKDKKSYQMDPANRTEALIEMAADEAEGADILMVKPAIHYLDVIQTLDQHTTLPITAYHVSGECAMLLAACKNGWLDYEQAMPETLLSIRRAGANGILTYLAMDYARWWKQHH